MAYSKILTVAALTVAALSACTAAPQPEKSDMSNVSTFSPTFSFFTFKIVCRPLVSVLFW